MVIEGAASWTGAQSQESASATVAPAPAARFSRAVQVGVIVLATIALLWAMREARLFLMPTMLGGLVALAATPLCAAIERTGLPSSVAAMLVTLSILVGTGALGWYMLPSLDTWRYRAPEVAITLERKLRRLESQVQEVTDTAAQVAPDVTGKADAPSAGRAEPEEEEGAQGPQGPAEQIVEGGRRLVVNMVGAAPELLGALVYGAFLVYFLMAERRRVQRWAMMAATSRAQAARIGRTLIEIRHTVGRYLATVAVINMLLGVATATAFWLIGMPAPILWGVFMTLMNFMPYLGPLIVQACAFAVGFVTFDTMAEAFYPVAALLTLNIVEGQLLTPTVLGRRLSASPLAVFLAVAFGAWMWGVAGAIVATPALIVGANFASLWAREARRQQRLAREAAQAAGPNEGVPDRPAAK